MNERKLTKDELTKRTQIIRDMVKNKRSLVKRYGKEAEKVMYGRATKMAKSHVNPNTMKKPKDLKELIKSVLQKPLQKENESLPSYFGVDLTDDEKEEEVEYNEKMNKLKAIFTEEDTPRSKYIHLINMYKQANSLNKKRIKSQLEKAAKKAGIKLQLDEFLKGKKQPLKEFTTSGGNYRDSFQHRIPKESPGDMFAVKEVEELFPYGMASRGTFEDRRKKHIEWTKDTQHNNTFVHIQFSNIEENGIKYGAHQTQYYNHHYDDFRSPGYTSLYITKNEDEENEEVLGTYIVDTNEYIKDLKNLNITKRVSENLNEAQKYDIEAVLRDIREFNRGNIGIEQLATSAIKNLGYKPTPENIDEVEDHFLMNRNDNDKIFMDSEVVRELYGILNNLNEQEYASDIEVQADNDEEYQKLKQDLEENYMGNKGETYMVSKAGSKAQPSYVLEKPDGSAQIDMTFSSPEEAKKYASKKGLKVSSKSGYNMSETLNGRITRIFKESRTTLPEIETRGYRGNEFVFILLNNDNKKVKVKGTNDSYQAFLKIEDKYGKGNDAMLYSIDGKKLGGFGGIEPKGNQDFSNQPEEEINEAETPFNSLSRKEQLQKAMDFLNSRGEHDDEVIGIKKFSKHRNGFNVTYEMNPKYYDDRDSGFVQGFIYPHQLGIKS